MAFKITAKEKAFILKRRKRKAVKARGPEIGYRREPKALPPYEMKIAEALDRLIAYFEDGVVRVKKLENILRKIKSPNSRYIVDTISRIKDGFDITTDEMETLKEFISG